MQHGNSDGEATLVVRKRRTGSVDLEQQGGPGVLKSVGWECAGVRECLEPAVVAADNHVVVRGGVASHSGGAELLTLLLAGHHLGTSWDILHVVATFEIQKLAFVVLHLVRMFTIQTRQATG